MARCFFHDRRHMLALGLYQGSRGPVLFPFSSSRERGSSLQPHLGQGQIPLVGPESLGQLGHGKDASVVRQQAEVVQLFVDGPPAALLGQRLNGLLTRDSPDKLQVAWRQRNHAPQDALEFLSGQDLLTPPPPQAASLDPSRASAKDRGTGRHPRRSRRRPPNQHDLQADLLRKPEHGVGGLFPASPGLGQAVQAARVVPGSPTPILGLGREKDHHMGVVVDLPCPVLRMEIDQAKQAPRLPGSLVLPNPLTDRNLLDLPQ